MERRNRWTKRQGVDGGTHGCSSPQKRTDVMTRCHAPVPHVRTCNSDLEQLFQQQPATLPPSGISPVAEVRELMASGSGPLPLGAV